MITNTDQGQKSLALLLHEIEEEYKSATKPEHFYALALLVPLLVKALRRAMAEVASSLRPVKRNIKFQAEITAILEGKEQEPKALEEPGAVR